MRASRLCRLEALGLTTTIPSTISIPAHCSSDQESYCSALICECIHAGATISAVMAYLLRGASKVPALLGFSLVGEAAPVRAPPARPGIVRGWIV